MAAHYKLQQVKNGASPQQKPLYSVSLKSSGNTTLKQIATHINQMSSFSTGDVTGLIDSLISVMIQSLSRGETVTIDGLGTFSVSAELKKTVINPEAITGNDIRLKRICFKPVPAFKDRIEEKISFIKQKSEE